MTIQQQQVDCDQGAEVSAALPKAVSRSPDSSYKKPVSRLRQLLPRMHSHGSKSDTNLHSKRGSGQHTDSKRSSSLSSNTAGPTPAEQAGSSSQHRQQQQQPAQAQPQQHPQHPQQQPKQQRWHRHHQQQQAGPMSAQMGPLAGSSAQAAAGKSFSGSSGKQRSERGFIAVTATAHHATQQQRPQQQQAQQQQPVLGLQRQQQQPAPHYGFPAPPAGPLGAPALAADSPSSLLLPPAQGTQSQQQQQQQQQPAVPADVDQDKCKRLAEVLLKCGKPADASAWAQAALSTDPWNVDLLLLRGRALEAAGNIPGAFTSYMSSLARSPNHLPTLMAVAGLYKARGMLDEARTALQSALQIAEAAANSSSRAGNGGGSSALGSSKTGTGLLPSSPAAAAAAAAAEAEEAEAEASSDLDGTSTDTADADDGDQSLQLQSQPSNDGSALSDMSTSSNNGSDGSSGGPESCQPAAAPGAAPVPLATVKEALAVVLTDLGTRAKNAGRASECESLYRQALALCPTYPSAHYNLGVLASESRRWLDALQHYKDTLALAPHHAQALCNSGVVYRELDMLEEAVAAYEDALAVAPNYPIVRNNLAVALTDLGTTLKVRGQLKTGIACYERALALMPRHADALYNLGVACAEDGQTERALFCYELTTHFNPNCAEAWNNLGVLHKEADNLERAAECYMAALNIRPNFPQSLNNLAVVLTSQGKAGEALSLLQAAISACPTYAEAHNNLGVLQRDVGAIPDALSSYERALQLVPDSRNAGQNRLLALNYIYPGEDRAVCAAHVEWGAAFQAQFAQHVLPEVLPAQRNRAPGRPLRVGYVSPDMFTHSVSYFAEAPLSHHDPSRVKLFVYSCVGKPDAKTTRLQAKVLAGGGVWRDVGRLPEAALAQQIRQDEIDILVELTGHTANNRLGVCAMRAAPVQVTWIGYPNSTGLSAVDYRITDAICDPEDTEQTFAEELVRLPGSFLCYTPAAEPPAVAPLPAAHNGFVTFGSFNNLAKITPTVLTLWARILHSIPTSRLVLKAKPFSCATARQHIAQQLESAGVAAWRFDLLPLTASTQDHLSVYSLMDISLDTFPYSGTTTTTESLFMGVPVITLAGRCHAHNVSVSLLTAIGLKDEWVAQDAEQYVQLAIQHASNVPALQQLRSTLRQDMLASPLCDAAPFVSDLEDLYQALWQRWVQEGGRQKPLLGMPGTQALLQQQQQQQQGRQQRQQQRQLMDASEEGSGSEAAAAADDDALVTLAKQKSGSSTSSNGGSSSFTGGGKSRRGGDRSSSGRGSGSGSGVKSAAQQQPGSSNDHKPAVPNGQQQPAVAAGGGVVAAGAGAGAVDSSSNDSGCLQKSRKLSSSCDAAATVHSAVAAAAAAAVQAAVDDTLHGSDLQPAAPATAVVQA